MSCKKQKLAIDSNDKLEQSLIIMVKQYMIDSKISSNNKDILSADRIKNDQSRIMKRRFIYSDDEGSSDEEHFNDVEKNLSIHNDDDSTTTIVDDDSNTTIVDDGSTTTIVDDDEATIITNKEATIIANETKIIANEKAKIIANEEAKIIVNEETKIIDNKEAKIIDNEEAKIIANEEAKIIANEEAKIIAYEEVKIIANEEAKIIANEETKIIANEETIIDSKESIDGETNIFKNYKDNRIKTNIDKSDRNVPIKEELLKADNRNLILEYKSEWAKYQITKRECEFINKQLLLQEKKLKKIKHLLGYCDCTIECVDKK
ncbi:41082_t:CDS:1 [Gigaspora margarita]|uniref:41082_t:CDS:1 n=1 Tax=Gigaspora margarita TaxID=4874 RepID=A0ABN7UXV9_GIGMA|nr:41082_t:CDS:1 [Gigaspora margarita]